MFSIQYTYLSNLSTTPLESPAPPCRWGLFLALQWNRSIKCPKGRDMIGNNYKNRGSNIAFSMGNKKPTGSERETAGSEDAKSLYKREIQSLAHLINLLKMELEDISNLTPTDEQTKEITNAIDSGAYVSKEIEIGVKIRDLEKKLETARKRFQFLFGDNY